MYAANFAEQRDIAEPGVIAECLRRAAGSGVALEDLDDGGLLRRNTAHAQEIGIFGAPSFVADGELFWGNDRLEDALQWAAGAQR